MILREYTRIKDIQPLWDRLYNDNHELSWFQSFEWYSLLELEFFGYRWTKYLFATLTYYVIDEKVIIPVVTDRIRRESFLLGDNTCTDYLSPIFDKELSEDDLLDYLNFFLDTLTVKHFRFNRINEHSVVSRTLLAMASIKQSVINKKECVLIDLSGDSSFYETISKNSRQNYRTAKNRLSKDGHTYQIDFEKGTTNSLLASKMLEVYNRRRSNCSSEASFIVKLKNAMKSLLSKTLIEKRFDLVTEYCLRTPVVYSCIYIDNVLAAFYCGQYNNDKKSVSICRVATNPDYYKYSPGQILFVETLDNFHNLVDIFDLTRGSEDYKFKMGGIIHHNYEFLFVI